ncbi:hypothetical protein [Pseudoalteromonas sp. Of7M-16]|nr:hypothetical protein [Pseudoalteromonas sp. Of7M-16]MCG7547733.1 hypothetical protein [Pseudoalteromonas sp. Of7M-16]
MKYLITPLLLLAAPLATACKCIEFNVGQYLSNAEKVYLGRIISSQMLGSKSHMSATLKVAEKYRGEVFDLEEVVQRNSSCSLYFTLNEEYLVFEGKNGEVNQCSMRNTRHFRDLENQLKALRAIAKLGI